MYLKLSPLLCVGLLYFIVNVGTRVKPIQAACGFFIEGGILFRAGRTRRYH
jgi:hypothetical protein